MNEITFLDKVAYDELSIIYDLLEETKITFNKNKQGRARTFGDHYGFVLGYIVTRVGQKYQLSKQTKKNPELYDLIKQFGEKYFPSQFSSIQVNKNVTCPRHLDKKNVGNSMLVSFGNYEGGNIVIEPYGELSAKYHPIIFNGSELYHYNTPILNGTKYSLVFYKTTNPAYQDAPSSNLGLNQYSV